MSKPKTAITPTRAENYAEWYPVWRTIDGKPVVWSEEPQPPVWHTWMRLFETPPLAGDPFLEAARTAMWMDLMMWNAAAAPHWSSLTHLAPSLDLSLVFQTIGSDVEIGPETVIGPEVRIGDGARIRRSVILEGADVPAGADLDGAVVFAGWRLET